METTEDTFGPVAGGQPSGLEEAIVERVRAWFRSAARTGNKNIEHESLTIHLRNPGADMDGTLCLDAVFEAISVAETEGRVEGVKF